MVANRRTPTIAIVSGVLWLTMNLMMPGGSDRSQGFMVMTGVAFLPPIIASVRAHRNRMAIFVLILALIGILTMSTTFGVFGFVPALVVAVIGWIVALVWSCTSNTE